MSQESKSDKQTGRIAIGENGNSAADGMAPSVQTPLPLDAPDGPSDPAEIAALLEALLLVAPAPTTAEELARGAGVALSAVDAALAELEQRDGSGWVLQRHGGKVQLATAPRFAGPVRRFLGLEREARLSGAALETLAIVAYQQPVTKSEIEAVRGVDCSGVLHTLLQRGLIEQVGRVPGPGNPIQYGTTPDFLLHFGLRSLADLPPLGQMQGQDVRSSLEAAIAAAQLEPVDPKM
jgi:segregation and condensation protein B